MARDPRLTHLHETFQTFAERCLLTTGSMILPEHQAWTRENVAEVKRRLIDNSAEGKESFSDKLAIQMAGATPDQWLVLADAHYLYYLPSSIIKPSTKLSEIRMCLQQGGLEMPTQDAALWEPFRKGGFVRTGIRYHMRYLQLWLILLFSDWMKRAEDPLAVLKDHVQMQRVLDDLINSIGEASDRAYDTRHALLFLAHPDYYERSISTQDKKKIVKHYGERLGGPISKDLDAAIRQIRDHLGPEYDKPERPFDFYTDLRHEWSLASRSVTKLSPLPTHDKSDSEPLPLVNGILSLFERTRNIVLYGPPGTGKTYIAQQVASALSYEDAHVERVTFHQSYSYEDFVEGWRPVRSDDGNDIAYRVVPGVLRRVAERAQKEPNHKHLLLIDEINRGNIAKVFGEIITLIEDDKRLGQANELRVTLPYSGEEFGIPHNLYLIGTMNTADRSIALLDVALRRRFAFVEIMPDPALLSGVVVASENQSVDLGVLLDTINRRITRALDRNYQLGHSYFLSIGKQDPSDRLDELEYIWNQQVLPLLEEYFYSQREVLAELLVGFADTLDEGETEDQQRVEFGRLTGEDLVYALNQLTEQGRPENE